MSTIKLYHYWRSSASWRVRWALALKGLDVDYVHVSLINGESEGDAHKRRNPLGFVPVLEVEGRYLIESVAILEWLDEKYPNPTFYPGDAFQRAHVRSLVEMINAGIQPIQNLTVLDYYSADEKKRTEWSQYFIERGLTAFQTRCLPSAGKFCVGDGVTAADLYLVPQFYNAIRNHVNLAPFKALEDIYNRCLFTPACQASAPDKFKPGS